MRRLSALEAYGISALNAELRVGNQKGVDSVRTGWKVQSLPCKL